MKKVLPIGLATVLIVALIFILERGHPARSTSQRLPLRPSDHTREGKEPLPPKLALQEVHKPREPLTALQGLELLRGVIASLSEDWALPGSHLRARDLPPFGKSRWLDDLVVKFRSLCGEMAVDVALEMVHTSQSPKYRSFSLALLGGLKDERAISGLYAVASDPTLDSDMKTLAIWGLAGTGSQKAWDLAKGLFEGGLEKQEDELLREAVWGIGAFAGLALPYLLQLEEQGKVRGALNKIAATGIEQELYEISLNHASKSIRNSVLTALLRQPSPRVLADGIAALRDNRPKWDLDTLRKGLYKAVAEGALSNVGAESAREKTISSFETMPLEFQLALFQDSSLAEALPAGFLKTVSIASDMSLQAKAYYLKALRSDPSAESLLQEATLRFGNYDKLEIGRNGIQAAAVALTATPSTLESSVVAAYKTIPDSTERHSFVSTLWHSRERLGELPLALLRGEPDQNVRMDLALVFLAAVENRNDRGRLEKFIGEFREDYKRILFESSNETGALYITTHPRGVQAGMYKYKALVASLIEHFATPADLAVVQGRVKTLNQGYIQSNDPKAAEKMKREYEAGVLEGTDALKARMNSN